MPASDRDLVHSRDTDALARRYYEDVYRLALYLLKNTADASDVTQETFARAFARLDSYQYDRSFRLWLFSIATNYIRDLSRRRKSLTMESADGDTIPVEGAPDQSLLKQENRAAVQAALGRLPMDFQTVLTLQFREKMSPKEISAILGVSANAVRIRLYRALSALRQELS